MTKLEEQQQEQRQSGWCWRINPSSRSNRHPLPKKTRPIVDEPTPASSITATISATATTTMTRTEQPLLLPATRKRHHCHLLWVGPLALLLVFICFTTFQINGELKEAQQQLKRKHVNNNNTTTSSSSTAHHPSASRITGMVLDLDHQGTGQTSQEPQAKNSGSNENSSHVLGNPNHNFSSSSSSYINNNLINNNLINNNSNQEDGVSSSTFPTGTLLPNTPNGVVVLGMHRSGTSLLTGLLTKVMGYKTGGPLLPPISSNNAKGFFELISVMRQNEYFLHSQGLAWNSSGGGGGDKHVGQYNATMAYWNATALENTSLTFDKGRQALETLLGNTEAMIPYILKEPRLCITLPTWLLFWQEQEQQQEQPHQPTIPPPQQLEHNNTSPRNPGAHRSMREEKSSSPHPLSPPQTPAIATTTKNNNASRPRPLPAILFTYRHPIQVARSLQRRNRMTLEQGLRLWILYNVRALQNSAHLCRVVTRNSALVKVTNKPPPAAAPASGTENWTNHGGATTTTTTTTTTNIPAPYNQTQALVSTWHSTWKELNRIVSELTAHCHVPSPPLYYGPDATVQQRSVIQDFVDPSLQHHRHLQQQLQQHRALIATMGDTAATAGPLITVDKSPSFVNTCPVQEYNVNNPSSPSISSTGSSSMASFHRRVTSSTNNTTIPSKSSGNHTPSAQNPQVIKKQQKLLQQEEQYWHWQAMKLYCDLESGAAFQPNYSSWPSLSGL